MRRITLVEINIFAYLLLAVSFFVGEGIHPVSSVQSILFIFIIFVLGGINVAALLQGIRGKLFSRLEFTNVSCASGLVVIPVLNLYGFFVGGFNNLRVLFVSGAILILNIFIRKTLFGNGRLELFNPGFVLNYSMRGVRRMLFSFTVFVVYFAVAIVVITQYLNLPDLDPYVWLTRTNNCLAIQSWQACFDYRPLFETFNVLFTLVSGVNTYMYYKYVAPLVMMLCFFPALLVGNLYNKLTSRVIMVMLPLAAPSTLLYLFTPMPQAIAIVLAVYFTCWLIYSYKSGEGIFYYLAGMVSIPIFWYHEVGAAFLLLWLIVTVWVDRGPIIGFMKKKKIAMTLLVILLGLNFSFFSQPFLFLNSWANKLFNNIGTGLNLRFPAVYVNIDGNSMGWGSIGGIFKYYIYYAGPLILAIIAFCFILGLKFSLRVSKTKESLRQVRSNLYNNNSREVLLLVSLFLFFITISEILPRLFGFAFLPERMWIFAGVCGYVLLVVSEKRWQASRFWPSFFLLAIFISIGGAIYINYHKQYVLPDYKLEMADWIKKNLPENRVIISAGNKDLIRFHADSRFYYMPGKYFCDNEVTDAEAIWALFEGGVISYKPSQADIEEKFKVEFAEFLVKKSELSMSSVAEVVSKYSSLLAIAGKELTKKDILTVGYIYYYKEDERNPYASRPYAKKDSECDKIIFDGFPENFRSVYQYEDKLKIWKIVK